ncbi:MAG: hypothetical protein IJX65_07030 [Alistipes sp.]|nr:hypothetical protein [Alistipes sp.]
MHPILQKISTEWFLLEPALFSTLLTHKIVANPNLMGLFRVGQMRLEYNPALLNEEQDINTVELRLRYEVVRILLGHPYMRQPLNAIPYMMTLASNRTIIDNFPMASNHLLGGELELESGLCFEEYYALLSKMYSQMPDNSVSDNTSDNSEQDAQGADEAQDNQSEDSGSDGDGEQYDNGAQDGDEAKCENDTEQEQMLSEQSELWEESPLAQDTIHESIRSISESNSWGTLPGDIVEQIKSSLIVKVDYRRILSMFRASVLSSKRHLTRMLPSRRYGFDFMGSKRDFSTRLLVAIDVSGSIDSKQIEVALAVINKAFRYGVEAIDVIQFDTEIHGSATHLQRKINTFDIKGRGGTNFQPAVDYYASNNYDGLFIITDGYAPQPTLPPSFHGGILWMLYNESAYKSNNRYTLPSSLQWLCSMPRSRHLILPPV